MILSDLSKLIKLFNEKIIVCIIYTLIILFSLQVTLTMREYHPSTMTRSQGILLSSFLGWMFFLEFPRYTRE